MSPRTQQQFKEMREEKMTLIMDVALQHFANEGYYRTTISHIARHAGISKGLMYNYFESKEALLKAIVHKSVNEVYHFFDINKDGYLTEEEFEFFIRKIDHLLKSKRSFWRLIFQLLIQIDIREQFIKAFPVSDSMIHPGHEPDDSHYPSRIYAMIRDYFIRKKEKKGEKYNPETELSLFFISIEGYALTSLYSVNENENALNRIIEIFK